MTKENMGINIVKRNGKTEEVDFDKPRYRLKKLADRPDLGKLENVDIDVIAQQTIKGIIDGISSSELALLSADNAVMRSLEHPEYGTLASRILIDKHHKNTTECFSSVMESLYKNKDISGNAAPVLSLQFMKTVRKYKDLINHSIDYKRDYLFSFSGFKTLEKSYLQQRNKNGIKVVAERPQHLYMRVALAIICGKDDDTDENIQFAIKYYDLMSLHFFTHASPTLFNAGTICQNMSSCFVGVLEDSMRGIYKGVMDCALISKTGGGIGMSLSNIRCSGSIVRGTNGVSDGLTKVVQVFNATCRHSNQGSKRNGSFAMYLELFHGDIFEFLELRLNTGKEENRARDLFYGLWISDIFMRAVENDSDWYLMNPDICKGLVDAYGEEFDKLYNGYIEQGMYIKKVKARDIWDKILVSQQETGMPYMLYKDSVNLKSNQSNIGTIKSSNLCCEQLEYADEREFNVCNISTVSLKSFIETGTENRKFFNYQKLYDIVQIMTIGMNKVIDKNTYPIPETKYSNMKHRPIIVGTQGISSVFFELEIPFECEQAKEINSKIFETIQYATWSMSCELAKKYGKYETYEGSPISQGKFQHNLWNQEDPIGLWDWSLLRQDILIHGVRNSLCTGQPPTASTATILNNFESIEPIHSNFFVRSVLSGEFPIVNEYLVKWLMKNDLWTTTMKNKIMYYRGSVQEIEEIPREIRNIFKTVWEIPQRVLLDYSKDRGFFTDHSQSLNVYMENPTQAKMTSLHFHGWKIGLKTGSYYFRTQSKSKPVPITVEKLSEEKTKEILKEEALICSIKNKDECMSCQ